MVSSSTAPATASFATGHRVALPGARAALGAATMPARSRGLGYATPQRLANTASRPRELPR